MAIFQFTDADGNTLDMLSSTVRAQQVDGLDAMPVETITTRSPIRHGEQVLTVQGLPRFITTELVIDESSAAAFATLRRTIQQRLNTTLGLGVIEFRHGDSGTTYEIDARVERVSAVDESPRFGRVTVQWRCPNPLFRSTTTTTTTITIADTATSASATVTNNGDVISYPSIAVAGTVDDPEMNNDTTSEVHSFSARSATSTVPSGRTLTSDMLNLTAELDDDTNWIDRLTNASVFWGLETGANTVTVKRSDTSGAKDFTVDHYDWYIGV